MAEDKIINFLYKKLQYKCMINILCAFFVQQTTLVWKLMKFSFFIRIGLFSLPFLSIIATQRQSNIIL